MLAVGTMGFTVDFGLFNLLLVLGLAPNAANVAAMLTSGLLVFGANLRWTYEHRDVRLPHHSATKFLAVQVASLALIALGVAVVTAFSSSVVLWNAAKVVLTIVIGFGRFYAYREWVYSDHGRPPPIAADDPQPSS